MQLSVTIIMCGERSSKDPVEQPHSHSLYAEHRGCHAHRQPEGGVSPDGGWWAG